MTVQLRVPHVKSAVNGILIPMNTHQVGIMHRFEQPENRLVIAGVSMSGTPDDASRLVVPATPDTGVPVEGNVDANAEINERLAADAARIAELEAQLAQSKASKGKAKAAEPAAAAPTFTPPTFTPPAV